MAEMVWVQQMTKEQSLTNYKIGVVVQALKWKDVDTPECKIYSQ